MAENKPFVVNDRRKFTADGELRPDAPPSPEPAAIQTAPPPAPPVPEPSLPALNTADTTGEPDSEFAAESFDDTLPPPPTPDQIEAATRAYDATVDRLDTAIRATNPGMERLPEMSFERFVQALYMQAILQLGGGSESGQASQIDLLGARQTIAMLSILASKVTGNLSANEDTLLQSALFELRMGFLEVTQALSRQAASRSGTAGTAPGMPSGPSIVR